MFDGFTDARRADASVARPCCSGRRDDLAELYGNPLSSWETWAEDLRGGPIDCGHHVAEEIPSALGDALVPFLTEGPHRGPGGGS